MAIHINPANKGKFTALKKRTGKSTEELTHSKNPLTRKRAIFAQNAKKWHHELGGELDTSNYEQYAMGGGLSRTKDYGSKSKPYPAVSSNNFAGGHRSYPIPTKADAVDALKLAGLHGRSDVKAKVYRKYPSLKKANGGKMYFLGGAKSSNEGMNTAGAIGGIAGGISGMIPTETKGGAAVSGALKGVEMGSALGPYGMAAGALIGGTAGFIAKENQMNREAFSEQNDAIRNRNQALNIKAKGGKLGTYNITNDRAFNDWYKYQPIYTKALTDKYKDLPIDEIYKNAINDKSFSNGKLDHYNDSLISKYGDKYLTEDEVSKISKENNIPNIFDLDNKIKEMDKTGIGKSINTTGTKETIPNKYGYRMMLQRSYPQGESPYNIKAMGGGLRKITIPMGVNQNQATMYEEGGNLTEFNTGGSHQQNPLGGVPQGVAQDGQQNLVEQGESKWQDYIFSDRLTADKDMVDTFNLPKSTENKTFSQISKKFAKQSKERPNDPISRDTVKENMNRLMQANDSEIQKVEQFKNNEIKAIGGKLFRKGGFKFSIDRPDNTVTLGDTSNSPLNKPFVSPLFFDPIKDRNELAKTGTNLFAGSDGTIANNGESGKGIGTEALRYAPIAYDALAATGLFGKNPKPKEYSPTLIQQQGNLSAPQIDEEALRSGIDTGYQNQIRGLADVSGGSGAAMRAGFTGIGNDYMTALGQGFLGANNANNQAKMQADQYNLGMSANVAGQNAGEINRANAYNTQIANQVANQNYQDRMNYLGAAAEGLGDIGSEEIWKKMAPKLFGNYNWVGDYMANKQKNSKAYGGKLKKLKIKK